MLIAHLSDFHVFTAAPETSLVRPDIVAVSSASSPTSPPSARPSRR